MAACSRGIWLATAGWAGDVVAKASTAEPCGDAGFYPAQLQPRRAGTAFFQNGPQRVFVDFDRAPYVARHTPQGVVLHPGEAVDSVTAAYLTPDGELWLSLSASRLAAVDDRDLAALAEGIHDTEGHAPSEADWAAWQIQQHALWLDVPLTTATPMHCPLLPIASMAVLWAQHGIASPPYSAPTAPV